jgi:DNA-binding NtrC family response regulator
MGLSWMSNGFMPRRAGRFTPKRVLLVEPDRAVGRRLQRACAPAGRVTLCPEFQTARARLLAMPPEVLITNLRLGEYNGLHLLMLIKTSRIPVRCVIVHTDRPDAYLIREAQKAGAFFEATARLPYAIPAYLGAILPSRDRRNAARFDRRARARGGRRAADQAAPSSHADQPQPVR